MRVVFDTNTVVSALLFGGSLAWLVDHWRSRISVPLVSRATADEFLRTFERYRERQYGVTVVTYDEVFGRVADLIALLEEAQT